MPGGFKSQFLINIGIAVGIVMVLLIALFLVGRDLQSQSMNIKTIKSDLKTRVEQLNDLAQLREDAKQAEPNLVKLEVAVPSRDELFSLRRGLEQLAARNNLAVNFSFGQENPKENNFSSINFELKLQGGDFDIRNFISQVESSYPFIRITALDMVRQENDFSTIVKGKIMFNQ